MQVLYAIVSFVTGGYLTVLLTLACSVHGTACMCILYVTLLRVVTTLHDLRHLSLEVCLLYRQLSHHLYRFHGRIFIHRSISDVHPPANRSRIVHSACKTHMSISACLHVVESTGDRDRERTLM